MATPEILPTSFKVPGTFLQVSLAVGPRSSADSTRRVVLYGNKTSAGAIAVETEIEIDNEDDARAQAGAGSELFLMFVAARNANPLARISMIAITEAGTAATGTITPTGTATAAGTVEVTIGKNVKNVAFASGDAAATIAAAIEAAIDDEGDWPVTAATSLGVVTATAKNTGPRGNHIRLRARVVETGTGITVATSGSYLSAGATSDDPQNAIDAIAERRHYHVAPYELAAEITKFVTRVNANDEPSIGLREVVVSGSRDTLANTTTLATGQNAPRLQVGWKENADNTPAEMAAALAARRARLEGQDAAFPLVGIDLDGLKPTYAAADVPTTTELDSALNNGITPLVDTIVGTVQILRSITSKSQDAGALPDYRVLDTHKVTVPDFIADDIEVAFAADFAEFKLRGDDPDGEDPPPGVATPASVKDWLSDRLEGYEAALPSSPVLLENVASNISQLTTSLSATAGRVNASVPIDVVEWLVQAGIDIRQIG